MNADHLALTGELAEQLTPEKRLLGLPPGIHLDVPEDVYHARVLGFASKSALDQVLISPAHYHAWVTGTRVRNETRALRLGKAVHCAVLEPERFAREYVIEPDHGDLRTREAKLRRDAFRAEHAGAKLLRGEEGFAAMGMVRALAEHATVTALLEGSRCEVTVRFDLGAVPCKVRVDVLNDGLAVAVDLKKTTDARPEAFSRTVLRYGYHRQADLYTRGLAAAGSPVDSFIFIAVEEDAPHGVWPYVLDDAALDLGRRENDRAIALIERCVERGEWPAYPEDLHTLSLPRWAER